jgi:ADP-heptose:LPS heptosyltransferase/8-oxo-dGTP pyrophosphatase MutT (NUDIX family)
MKILIIKLGAKGDVLRTMPLAKALKEKYPNCKIRWVTRKDSMDLLENSKFIEEVFCLPYEKKDEFDLLYNFDMEDEATELAMKIKADKKYGFYKEGDFASSFNIAGEYYLNTLFDDEIKKKNRKTYQEMMFELAELDYKKQHVLIELNEKDKQFGIDFIKNNGIKNEKIIGIHMGAGARWPSKAWGEKKVKEFIIKAHKKGYSVLLFGGPEEQNKQNKLYEELTKNKIKIYRNNPFNSNREFASLVNICSVMVCSDSFSLHVSLGLKKNTIGLFFCTPPWEVEDYGLLRKITSKRLNEFFPEKMDQYNEELVNSIQPDEIFEEIKKFDYSKVVNGIIKKNKENKFLIVKRKEEDYIHPGKWAFAGGLVEKDETTAEALEREIKEETGLNVTKIMDKISEYEYYGKDKNIRLGECYYVSVLHEDFLKGDEVREIRWASLEEIKKTEHIEEMEQEIEILIEILNKGNK